MKIKISILALFAVFAVNASAQENIDKATIKDVITKVADRVVSTTDFDFVNLKTGETYTSLKGVEPSVDVAVHSYTNDWRYENGVTFLGLQQVSEVLGRDDYKNFVAKNFDWIFNNGHLNYFENVYNGVLSGKIKVVNEGEFANADGLVGKVSYHQYFRLNRLDDCGSLAASMIESCNRVKKQKEFVKYIEKTAHYMAHDEHRLSDGTFCRTWPRKEAVWADDLYMGIPFMAKYATMSGDASFYDDAANQIIAYYNLLWNSEKELFHHSYYNDTQEKGVAHWGRSNGWAIVAQVMLLEELPVNHPKRDELIAILKAQIDGIARYQDADGLWHQLLDKADSYQETSCTAMFVYGIAKAVNEGWVDKDYMNVAEYGWQGLLKMCDAEYNLTGVCMGTGISPSLSAYYTRPTLINGHHAIGAFLLAGSEMYKSEKFAYPMWE